jgi:hypothetical protein
MQNTPEAKCKTLRKMQQTLRNIQKHYAKMQTTLTQNATKTLRMRVYWTTDHGSQNIISKLLQNDLAIM